MNRIVSVAAIIATCLAAAPAHAARLLVVKVEHAGKVAQTSFYEDDGKADKRTVWNYLGGDPLAVEGGGSIVASPDNELHSLLLGPVTITVLHANSPLIEARIENLNLARVRADRDRWYLQPHEVKRTGLAAGLKMEDEAPAMDAKQFWLRVLGIAVFLVMVFVVGFLLHRSRTITPSE